MKRGTWIGFLLLCVGLVVFASCTPTAPDINFNNYNNATNNNGGGNTASPSPTSDTLPAGSTVRVGIFGADCPTGTAAPPNSSGQIRVACRGAGITATPKAAGGADLPETVHGTQVEWQVSGGGVTCSGSYLGNVFNQFCTCPAGSAGTTFSLSAKVKNVTGVLNGSCVP